MSPIDIQEGDSNLSAFRPAWSASMAGPDTRQALESDQQVFLHQALSTPCLDALASCEGIYITNLEGKSYMDFHGNAVHQIGYRNPYVINKVKGQLDQLPFSPRRFTNLPSIELAQKLVSLLSPSLSRVLFAPSGSNAISMALKLARLATGKHKTISWWDSFHGASLDAIAAGGEREFRAGLGPLMAGCERIPPPNSYRGIFPETKEGIGYADYLEYVIEKEGDIAAFIAEPVRSSEVQIPSTAFWKRVREICDRHQVILILDEIPTAFGRTGKMFAHQHFGIDPDILCLGKGLGAGVLPLAAMVAREDLNRFGQVSLGHFTHEKNPLAAVAGLAMIEYIENNHLLARAQYLEGWLSKRLGAMKEKYPLIGDLRGIGLLWGIELVTCHEKKTRALAQAESILYDCLQHGLSFKVAQGNTIQLAPPLTISDEELSTAMDILESAISKADHL